MPQPRGSSDYVRDLKNRALAASYAPRVGISLDSSVRIAVRTGQQTQVVQPIVGLAYDVSGCCQCSPPRSDIVITVNDPQYAPVSVYNYSTRISWEDVGASSYTISVSYYESNTDTFEIQYDTETSAFLFSTNFPIFLSVTLTVSNLCGTSTSSVTDLFPCFLAGSPVTLADGTTKPIEDICVGDWLLGAFGEHNQVLALHRPLLGSAIMCRINGEHSTTNHHPHIGADKRIYCNDPATVRTSTYGRDHPVINAEGDTVMMRLHGLAPERILQLSTGVVLKTVGGDRVVSTLETYTLPPDTQLYNLVMGGSHTYHVDGYAVTGWPREDDWDYDAWVPRG
jgi:hypothetical protein